MTTLDIENYANEEGLAIGASDVNLAIRLRRKVIPKFEADIGEQAWRRKEFILPVTTLTRSYDLPMDFDKMEAYPIYDNGLGGASGERTLKYKGEDPLFMSVWRAKTTPALPDAYWFERVTAVPPDVSSEYRKMVLNTIPSVAGNVRLVYRWTLRLMNSTDIVEMDNYMPPSLQWALVEGLKRELYVARFGIDSQRVANADGEYRSYVALAQEYSDPAAKNVLRHVAQGPK